MSAIASAIRAFERAPLPDPITRAAISMLVGTRRRALRDMPATEALFASQMSDYPIAQHASEANDQHYELPPKFFELTLGPQRKYSCCLYPTGHETLAEAERLALDATIEHAQLSDGQDILELGCGWGSLSLLMASRFPQARITAVSYSASQRLHIEAQARRRQLDNLSVVTADMNEFVTDRRYDRVVLVEMFEHMANWPALLGRVRRWLRPEGRVFLHVFSHRTHPYRFDANDQTDWIGQHFFTGGIMPSHGLIRHIGEDFSVEQEWRWSGRHYEQTARDWLARFDANGAAIGSILEEIYGRDAGLWHRRWRLFYLATAGLFGHDRGRQWGVSHFRLAPTHSQA